MGIRDDIEELRRLGERIDAARAELAQLRSERDALRFKIQTTRNELQNPLRGLDFVVVYETDASRGIDIDVVFDPPAQRRM